MPKATAKRPPKLEELPDVITVLECAGILRISRSAAYRAVRDGTIPAIRVGAKLRVPTHRIRELLDS